jgi:deoxyribonuclease V
MDNVFTPPPILIYPMVELERLRSIQERIAKKARIEDDFRGPDTIAGADVAYLGDRALCAAVVLDREMEVVEEAEAVSRACMGYVPGYLSFRESIAISKTIKDLSFDVLMLDGQGIAHPRRAGIATHIGVLKDIPTIGVAKKPLFGEVEEGPEVGSPAPIMDRREIIGHAVKTKKNTNPIYVSPGHRVSPESALQIVLECLKGYKLPEPTRLAHIRAGEAKRDLLNSD